MVSYDREKVNFVNYKKKKSYRRNGKRAETRRLMNSRAQVAALQREIFVARFSHSESNSEII